MHRKFRKHKKAMDVEFVAVAWILVIIAIIVGASFLIKGYMTSSNVVEQAGNDLRMDCLVSAKKPPDGAYDSDGDGYYDSKFVVDGKEIDCSEYKPKFVLT
ncbi:MAG: hypothetical protein ABIG89_06280 [Candidatus Woesearchaeota archaeon]